MLNSQSYLYFAYGSNMNSEQMETRFKEGPSKMNALDQQDGLCRWPFEKLIIEEKISCLGKGTLKNYELNFHKIRTNTTTKEGFASISPKENSQVEGVVYRVNDRHLRVLDFYEGVNINHYRQETVTVQICATNEFSQAVVYIAHPSKIDKESKPSKNYLMGLIKGAREFQLSAEMIQKLEQWTTTD